mmetsp:Transcript_93194/g.240833  ORF Transcript_93194/g.240833 Transcript_93194/m.240833 type:complete len:263 (+) Transcript_93194:341-1129(+)
MSLSISETNEVRTCSISTALRRIVSWACRSSNTESKTRWLLCITSDSSSSCAVLSTSRRCAAWICAQYLASLRARVCMRLTSTPAAAKAQSAWTSPGSEARCSWPSCCACWACALAVPLFVRGVPDSFSTDGTRLKAPLLRGGVVGAGEHSSSEASGWEAGSVAVPQRATAQLRHRRRVSSWSYTGMQHSAHVRMLQSTQRSPQPLPPHNGALQYPHTTANSLQSGQSMPKQSAHSAAQHSTQRPSAWRKRPLQCLRHAWSR